GSGKSTLLHLMGALDLPTSGQVYLDGTDIAAVHKNRLARLRGEKIGFVFQFFNLYPSLTARENVELPMVIHEVESRRRQERAIELLDRVGLSKREEHYPSQLSGGERQRVAIARAMANRPRMLLADEPTGNLDSKTGEEIMNVFTQLNKDDCTVVMVTHEKSIARHSERVVVFKDGRIEKDSAL
ncbi:MAG: ABC transporter ATP-binding protein, partial [Candidatus Aenigmarchaeota archaeon]|nr:ABC transporter ATP-binding protein [Candidatus Aenigmarchaeota archaeon]